MQTGSGAHLPS